MLHGLISSRFVYGEDFTSQYIPGFYNIYEHECRIDFFVYRSSLHPRGVYIEAKSQTSPGSADEKIPFLWENIRTIYNRPTIVVMDGRELRNARKWLETKVDGQNLLGIYDLSEFRSFWKSVDPIGQQKDLFT